MRGVWFPVMLAAVACGDSDDDDGDGSGDLAIVGSYVDEFGTEHEISEQEWVQTFAGAGDVYVFHVVEFDNVEERVVTHNALENAYNGNQFSAFDWFYDGQGDLFVCQTVFDGATLDDAEQAPRADDTDLTGGCSGFSWTKLTP